MSSRVAVTWDGGWLCQKGPNLRLPADPLPACAAFALPTPLTSSPPGSFLWVYPPDCLPFLLAGASGSAVLPGISRDGFVHPETQTPLLSRALVTAHHLRDLYREHCHRLPSSCKSKYCLLIPRLLTLLVPCCCWPVWVFFSFCTTGSGNARSGHQQPQEATTK